MNTELSNTDRRRGGYGLGSNQPTPGPSRQGNWSGEDRGRTSDIQHRTSNIEHPTSNIEHRTSNIEHPTSNDQCLTLNAPSSAFSLIELVGVLTVIAILAAVMVPSLIRHMDRIAGEQESAALKSLGDALQDSILRKRYIPGATDWATSIAAESGVGVTNVTTNLRRRPRFFLIDPDLRIGNNSSALPYNQPGSGSVLTNSFGVRVPPLSPRLLILSSIGRALPTNIVSGVSTDFNAIWDRNDTAYALPATSFSWTGWPNGEDLKVQRVNLSPLFVRLILTTNLSESAYYSIDATNTDYKVPALGSDGYFIRNSLLFLHQPRANIVSQEILTHDASFVYEHNVWRGSLTGGAFLASNLQLGSIVDKYLEAPENTNAMYTSTNTVNGHGNTNRMTQQSVVVSNMMAYMKAYTNWAAAGFPNNSLKDTAISIQVNMVTAVRGQYDSAFNGSDYLPHPTTNCPPCCPP